MRLITRRLAFLVVIARLVAACIRTTPDDTTVSVMGRRRLLRNELSVALVSIYVWCRF